MTRDVRCPRYGKAVVGTEAMWEQRQPPPEELLRRCLEHGTPPWNVPDSLMNGGDPTRDWLAARLGPIALIPLSFVLGMAVLTRAPGWLRVPLTVVLLGACAYIGWSLRRRWRR